MRYLYILSASCISVHPKLLCVSNMSDSVHLLLFFAKYPVLIPDLLPGQTVMVSYLTADELSMTYQSDATDEFVPYISNPNISFEMTERLLHGRYLFSF